MDERQADEILRILRRLEPLIDAALAHPLIRVLIQKAKVTK